MLLPVARVGARTTIVVTPLVALREHLLEQCERAGIACVAWQGDCAAHGRYLNARIIVVAAEQLRHGGFRGLLQVLQGTQQLERVVIDEAHLPLTAGHWRESLQHYDILTALGVPLLFLTATLPIRDEGKLLAGMRIMPAYARVLRSSTVRPNIAYSVTDLVEAVSPGVADKFGPAGVADFVRRYRGRFPAGQRKMIVFLNDIGRITRLVVLVSGAHAYYRDCTGGKDVLASFGTASDGILFCTSAADHGLDFADIDHVVHATWAESLTSYLQGSGRGGRDGRPATAVMLIGRGMRGFKLDSIKEREQRQVLLDYVQPASCRRVTIDRLIAGDNTRERCAVEKGEASCDVCTVQQQATADRAQLRTRDHVDARDRGITPPQSDSDDALHTGSKDDKRSERPPPYTTPLPPQRTARQEPASTSRITPRRPNGAPITPRATHPGRGTATRADPGSVASASPSLHVARNRARHDAPPLPERGLNAAHQVECMAWRAIWGDNGLARLAPLDRIRSAVLFWKFNCCAHLLLQTGAYNHTIKDCNELEEVREKLKAASRPWNHSNFFFMARWTGCWGCKLPMALCRAGGGCSKEWEYVVVDAWALLYLHPPSRDWCQQELQRRDLAPNVEDARVRKYLGQKIALRVDPEWLETIPLIDLLVEMTELFFLPNTVRLGSLLTYGSWDKA
jgi:hypothetical protein